MGKSKDGIRRCFRRLFILVTTLFVLIVGATAVLIYYEIMPGSSYSGSFKPLADADAVTVDNLKGHVQMLAGTIGERTAEKYEKMNSAAQYIKYYFGQAGMKPMVQVYDIDSQKFENITAEMQGSTKPEEIIVIGAHYDSVLNSPGANDNGSGVAALLEIARLMKDLNPGRTVRLVAFANEEPPYFQTEQMGSRVYTRRAKERNENIVAMLSIETIGYYSDKAGSQSYPPLVGSMYPDTGNFIAFIGNLKSRSLVRSCVDAFRRTADFPSEGAVLPEWAPGVDWSDHWSFWQEGYPAVMVTDTAPFRYPHYHKTTDTPDKLDYDRMAIVVNGLVQAITELARVEQK